LKVMSRVQWRLFSTDLLTGLSIVAAARGLAVDGNEVWFVRPAFGNPRRKAGRKKIRIDPVHDRTQPIGAWNAMVEFGKAPQKREMGFAPIDNIVVINAAGDRPARNQ